MPIGISLKTQNLHLPPPPKNKKIAEIWQVDDKPLDNFLPKDRAQIPSITIEINFFILLLTISRFQFSQTAYYKNYITFINPSFLFCCSGEPNFLCLAAKLPKHIQSVFIELSLWNPMQPKNMQLFLKYPKACSYIFSLSKQRGIFIANHCINAPQIYALGSIRNNQQPLSTQNKQLSIGFISQVSLFHSDTLPIPPKKFILGWEGDQYRYNMYKSEEIVVNFLAKYCANNNLEFNIMGRHRYTPQEEENFFRRISPKYPFNFIPCSKNGSYQNALKNEINISIDSTLGLELFALGCKVGFFNIREDILGMVNKAPFFWPSHLAEVGSFYTTKNDSKIFENIILFLLQVSPKDWEIIVSNMRDYTMNYDKDNQLLKSFVKQKVL